MDTVLLVVLAAGAAYAFIGRERLKLIAADAQVWLPMLEVRHVVGAGLLVAAALLWSGNRKTEPTPAPGPAPGAGLVLQGKFSPHPDAAVHAAQLAAMFGEVADELEWDSMQTAPVWTSGQAMDDLRIRAFNLRFRGQLVGDIHPRIREAIRAYLDQKVGTSGAPLSPAQKAEWIAAYREIQRANEEAFR
jgi:hypothetical protein